MNFVYIYTYNINQSSLSECLDALLVIPDTKHKTSYIKHNLSNCLRTTGRLPARRVLFPAWAVHYLLVTLHASGPTPVRHCSQEHQLQVVKCRHKVSMNAPTLTKHLTPGKC